MTVKILDCTIRDGGHLNGWNFSDELVRSAYYSACKSGVDYFEVGYRFKSPKEGFGKFAKCSDEYLSKLFDVKDDCKLTVMIDAGKSDTNEFVDRNKDLTPIRAVRVASYPYEIETALRQCEELKNKGYEVFLNLMVISEYKDNEYEILKNWNNKDILEALSFADSFGSFIPDDIVKYVGKLKSIGYSKIGFHSHNNLQLAFANALKAIECGAYIVDASAFGMGRGSGNLPIEILTGYLEKTGVNKYNPVAYIDLIDRFFLEENKKTPWGYRIQSLIGGLKNIHPYYVDGLYKKHLYTINEVWNAAELVKNNCPISFNEKEMNNILSDRFVNYDDISIINKIPITPAKDAFCQGKPDFVNLYQDRNFLIIANGQSVSDYKDEILKFIKDKNCVTIGTNFLNNLYTPDFHCFVNRKRFLKYVNSVSPTSTLLLPSFMGREFVVQNTNNIAMFFDVRLTDNSLYNLFSDYRHNYLGVNVAISAIYCAIQMGAKEIFVAGMDGFGKNAQHIDYFYKEADTEEDKKLLIRAYETLSEDLKRVNTYLEKSSIPFSIITPTSHSMYYKNQIGVNNVVKI